MGILASELQKIIDLNELGDEIKNDFIILTILAPTQIYHSERLLRSVDIQKLTAMNDAQESFNIMLQCKYQSITANIKSGNSKRASKQICDIISSEEYYNCILAADEGYHNMFNVSNNAISEVATYR